MMFVITNVAWYVGISTARAVVPSYVASYLCSKVYQKTIETFQNQMSFPEHKHELTEHVPEEVPPLVDDYTIIVPNNEVPCHPVGIDTTPSEDNIDDGVD